MNKGVEKTVKIRADGEVNALLAKTDNKKIVKSEKLKAKITAPVKKGDLVGYVHVYTQDKEIGKIKIVAAENVEKLSVWVSMCRILKGIFKI